MRLLISAFACGPGRGSEPGEGWNAVREAARRHEVTVLTTPEFRGTIEEAVRSDAVAARAKFVIVNTSPFLARGRLLGWLAYDHWQAAALRRARLLHAESPFDLAHHVTFATWRIPTLLHKLGIPVVWGPLGGGQDMPAGFFPILGARGKAWEGLRVATQRASRWDPRVRLALRKCAAVLAANSDTAEFLGALGATGVERMCEMGLDLADFPPPEPPASQDGPLRILWAGRLEHRKALPLLLHAMALPQAPRCTLRVLGRGPEEARWKAEAKRLGIADRVTFLGEVPRQEGLKSFREADVFVFSSLRDSTGWVFVESMAAGRPVIALDQSAAHDLVGADRGILVPARGIAGTAAGIADALARLAADPALRRNMGDAGRRFVERELTWSAYGDRLEAVYRRVTAEKRA